MHMRLVAAALPPVEFPPLPPSKAMASPGEVSEWLKEHAWKVCKRLNRASGVRIPLSPPDKRNKPLIFRGFFLFRLSWYATQYAIWRWLGLGRFVVHCGSRSAALLSTAPQVRPTRWPPEALRQLPSLSARTGGRGSAEISGTFFKLLLEIRSLSKIFALAEAVH